MNLGTLIELLRPLAGYLTEYTYSNPHSYRGYYEDIALEPDSGEGTVQDLIDLLQHQVLHESFEGYKGGIYHMNAETDVYVAWYGSCGTQVAGVSLTRDGTVKLVTEEGE